MAVVITSTSNLSDVVKAAYSEAVLLGYAPETFMRPFVNEGEIKDNAPQRGTSVTWTVLGQLADATTALSETVEPDSVGLTDTQATATLAEYGNVVTVTEKLKVVSFDNVTAGTMALIGANMGSTIERVVAKVAVAGTNVIYGGAAASRGVLAAGDKITATKLRQVFASLRGASIPRFGDKVESDGRVMAGMGTAYVGFIHPSVGFDLKEQSGAGAWRTPKEYSDPAGIYNGEIGMFEGIRWIETPNAELVQADAGAGSTVDVYKTLVFGYQYLGEGVGVEPEIRITGPFDKLGRLVNIGWYGLLGHARVREAAGYRIETSSSLGVNT